MPATVDVPWAEIAPPKDYPGLCAEHRVYEGGILRAVHRISSPGFLTWADRTRQVSGGLCPS